MKLPTLLFLGGRGENVEPQPRRVSFRHLSICGFGGELFDLVASSSLGSGENKNATFLERLVGILGQANVSRRAAGLSCLSGMQLKGVTHLISAINTYLFSKIRR